MMDLVQLRPRILSCRLIPDVNLALAHALGLADHHRAAGLVTCDQDDSLYAALDHATKFAPVDVVYARSFYAGSAHASGPLSGEILGVIAGDDPDEVAEGLLALRQALAEEICFYTVKTGPADQRPMPSFFPHVISSLGRYLSAQAGLEAGQPMAYLVAPPVEAIIGIDAALKSARVEMARFFGPPTETNFACAYLTGDLTEVEAAAQSFSEAIVDVVSHPLAAAVRPSRQRR